MKKDYSSYVDRRFSRLIVKEIIKVPSKHTKARCLCDCGKEIITDIQYLENGHSKSCGCYKKDRFAIIGKGREKHGYVGNKLYYVHQSMIARCENPSHKAYKDYGGRGIAVCHEWHDISEFAKWAKQSGYKDGLTLDRRDNDGNYEPSNCRWATWKEQGNNRRTTLSFLYNGENLRVNEILEMTGMSKGTFYSRLNNDWNIEKIIETPVNKRLSRNKKNMQEQAELALQGMKEREGENG